MVRTRSIAVNTADAALGTEPECLGPCEPGTSVNLEGIVWQETEDGEMSLQHKVITSDAHEEVVQNVCVQLIAAAC